MSRCALRSVALAGGLLALSALLVACDESSPFDDDAPVEGQAPRDADTAEPAAAFEAIVDEVAELRGLDPPEELPVEVVGSEEIVEIAMDASDQQLELMAQRQAIMVALHQLPEDAELEELNEQLLEDGVAGMYVPETGRSYVVADEDGLSAMERVVVAHEVVHALQDEHFDLGRMDDLRDDPDATLAFSSVIEGDAVLTQERWARTHLSEEEQQQRRQDETEAAGEQLRLLQELPEALMQSFLAPYTLGPQFFDRFPDAGYEAFDAVLADPPATTVEVLDPELYVEGFTPREVDPGRTPDGWDELETMSWGAFQVLLMLHLADGHVANPQVAAEWRGGRLRAWERGDEVAVGAVWSFGSAQAAARMCEVVPDWYATVADGAPASTDGLHEGPHDALAVDCDEERVRFALAPDAADAATIIGR